jgi:hypothetical protein
LTKIQTWASKWKVTFNPQKTESVTFSRKREIIIPEIQMANEIITDNQSHKHLGVILQASGRWSEHIADITQRAKRKVDILRGLMHRLDRRTLEIMYLTYIRPLLEFSNALFEKKS